MRAALVVALASGLGLLLLAANGALPARDAPEPRAEPLGFPGRWLDAGVVAERANATLVGVTAVWEPHWETDGAMRARVAWSYLAPSDDVASALVDGSAPVRVRVTVLDEGRDEHHVGFVMRPGEASDARPLHRWVATATGAPRTEAFVLPASAGLDGWWSVSVGVRVLEFRAETA